MASAKEVAVKFGLHNVDAAIAAAARAGLGLAPAFALIEQESGGKNIYGHDAGGVFSVKGKDIVVTEKNFKEFRKRVTAGETSNGCGPVQLTYPGFFVDAEKQGLRLWSPLDNCLYGFRLLAGYRKAYGSWLLAGVAYNSGPGTAAKGTATSYGRSFARRVKEWEQRLVSVPLPSSKPIPNTKPEEGPMAKVTWRGQRFDSRTVEMLKEVARRTKAYTQPSQGSYSTGVSASGGTHAGGGAVDISISGLSAGEIKEIVRVMREVGFAAWQRSPSEGPWVGHIHGVAIGCSDLAPVAARQVTAFKKGLSGLASGKPDRQASLGVKPTTWEAYLKKRDGKAAVVPKAESKPAPKAESKVVTVKAGDTLNAIAKANKTTVAAILKLNPSIKDAGLLKIGMKVRTR